MASLRLRFPALLVAASVALATSACAAGGQGADEDVPITPTTGVATTAEAPGEEFQVNEITPLTTDELDGDAVEDPGQPVSYVWQGTAQAPAGGTIVTVAVTNNSEAPMPTEALGDANLSYSPRGGSATDATALSREDAGMDADVGLDMQLGPGATTNVHYAFDVSQSSLSDAEFTIGNVTFAGDLRD